MLSDTVIGNQVKIGSLVYIGHGGVVEANAWLSAATAIAGHSRVDAQALVGIGTVIVDNVSVGARAVLGAGSVVTRTCARRDAIRRSGAHRSEGKALRADAAEMTHANR